MKEASGELNMTLITILAVAIIGGIFAALYPTIRDRIKATWTGTAGDMDNQYQQALQDQ